MRSIPATMATQHPDNAGQPFWEKDHDGFIDSREETLECVKCFSDLHVDEFMWDWEGKYADEAVIDRLFGEFHSYFAQNQIGRDKFLTFRIPNIWKEKGYNLIRALMVILTSEDFARDLKLHTPALFEIILPMTERAEELLYIQTSFQKLARFKTETFNHRRSRHEEYLEMIPLVESVGSQLGISELLERYLALHRREFKAKPAYLRPFLARSDPALVSGLVATVLANKIALSDMKSFAKKSRVSLYPILGAGSLPFRGNLNPDAIPEFAREYAGVRTATIQSAFRYDYPLASARRAVAELARLLPRHEAQSIGERERDALIPLIKKFETAYQKSLASVVDDLREFFAMVPRRRERRQHIGLLAYKRQMGTHPLPRTINFTAAFYSLGIPPEFLGLGRALKSLTRGELSLVMKYYRNFENDIRRAGKYLNRHNITLLARKNPAWNGVLEDLKTVEEVLALHLGPRTKSDELYEYLTSGILVNRHNEKIVGDLIVETGKVRRSLG